MAPAGADPPVGIINTNEGDMSPIWTEGSKQEAVHVARTIVARVEDLRRGPGDWQAEITLEARYREVDLPGEKVSDGGRTCRRSELGESVGYGACDHPTTNPNSPLPLAPCGSCQEPKLTPLGELERIVAGRGQSFPSHVPIGLVRLADSLVAFVPAEVTIGAGRLMRRALQQEAHKEDKKGDGQPLSVFLGGLSNGYVLYVTTEAEYRWHGKGGGCRLAGACSGDVLKQCQDYNDPVTAHPYCAGWQ